MNRQEENGRFHILHKVFLFYAGRYSQMGLDFIYYPDTEHCVTI